MNTKSLNEKLLNSGAKKDGRLDDNKNSKKTLGKHVAIINCIMGSIITVLVVMVFAFLQMLFSSGADGRRETFFNTLYFEAKTLANGNTEMMMGATGNFIPIIISVVVVALAYYAIYFFASKSKANN